MNMQFKKIKYIHVHYIRQFVCETLQVWTILEVSNCPRSTVVKN